MEIEKAYTDYLEKVGLSEVKMPSELKIETKRAFYAGVKATVEGSIFFLEYEGINFYDNALRELDEFWKEEVQRDRRELASLGNVGAQKMRELADGVRFQLNGTDLGFCILVFPTGEGEKTSNYISNCDREDMIAALKETAMRLESQQDFDTPEEKEGQP